MGQTILKFCFAFLFFVFSSNYVQANENINTGFVELTADESQTVVGGYSDTTNAILCIVAGTALVASAVTLSVAAIPFLPSVAFGCMLGVGTILAFTIPEAVTGVMLIGVGLGFVAGGAATIIVYDVVAGIVGCYLIKKSLDDLKDLEIQEENPTNVHKNYNYGDLSQFESSSFNSTDVLQFSMSF